MKGYRKPSGVYIECATSTPVSTQLIEVALRPSFNHVFADTWQSDPMNPSVCWRTKTTPEQNADKDSALQDFLDSAGGKALKAVALVGIDKGQWTLAELRTKYRSL